MINSAPRNKQQKEISYRHYFSSSFFIFTILLLILTSLSTSYAAGAKTKDATELLTTPSWNALNMMQSTNGEINDRIYAVFGEATVTGVVDAKGNPVENIWTRSYAKKIDNQIQQLLPGPGYIFHPGDLLNLTLINLMAEKNSPKIDQYDTKVNINFDTDEIITDHVDHEVNVPHNPNNTNIHVHGLHVDPNRDDVTIVITPIGDESEYIVFDKDNELTDASVSDQSVKRGGWEYSYRIPENHLPGTYWYHPHKHGSTAVQVENGMAGPLLIKPKNDADSLAPGLGENDRVMLMQEIYNYGIQQGVARSIDLQDADSGGASNLTKNKFNPANKSPDITINGIHQPTLNLVPGQTQRWRFINAGANHRSFTYLWLGKKTAHTDTTVTYTSVPMTLVANDGITRASGHTVTASAPVLLGPGNRADVFVQLNEPGEYALFKGWPSSIGSKKVTFLDGSGNTIKPIDQNNIADPYGLQPPNSTASTYANYKVYFTGANAPGSTLPSSKTALAPILTVTESNGLIAISEATKNFDITNSNSRWQTLGAGGGGGGAVNSQLLATIDVSKSDVIPSSPPIPSNSVLAAHSPKNSISGGTLANTPPYAAEIKNTDVVQSRAAVFDESGVSVTVSKNDTPQQTVKQFSLNGRVFALNDSIGNPAAKGFVEEKASSLEDISLPSGSDFSMAVKNSAGDYFTNEGYYQSINSKTVDKQTVYYWNTATNKPNYQDVTGLENVAIVNPNSTQKLDNLPGMPVAGTAEEWLLINNSSIGHPFHIHINPFFITEIGQLVYENNTWSVNKLTEKDTMGWMLNSWWDTIIIPPHGYVKVRQWINLPLQSADNTTLLDNVNREGSWVFHCHILRHEDRGMMMLVQTQQARSFNLAGNWVDPDGHQAKVTSTSSENMTFVSEGDVWWANGIGTWSGVQPFSGTQKLANANGNQRQTLDFAVSSDGTTVGFGNGIYWKKTAFTMATSATPINLTGTWSWTDIATGNTQTAAIVQSTSKSQLTIKPTGTSKGKVWWTLGSGSWNLGVGDPLSSQPYKGSVLFTQQEVNPVSPQALTPLLDGSDEVVSIFVSRDGNNILFSNGMKWTKQ